MKSKPTLGQIIAHNKKVGGHYFDADTLKFFGQEAADFKVRMIEGGRIILFAYTHRQDLNLQTNMRPSSLAEYNPETGEVSSPPDGEALKERFVQGT